MQIISNNLTHVDYYSKFLVSVFTTSTQI